MRNTSSGNYDISITWPAASGLTGQAGLTVTTGPGSYSQTVNEQPTLNPNDPWYGLGSYQFNRQTPYNGCRNLHRAQISKINADDGAVAADALRLRQSTRSESGRRVLVRTPEHFTYDADGNLVGDGRRGYGYDAENRLIWAGTSGGYRYDYRGRRSGKGVAGGDQIYCLYEGWNLLAELGINAPAPYPETWDVYLYRTHVWGLDLSGSREGAGGIGGLAATRQYQGGTIRTHYPLYDGNGNVTGLVAGRDGSLSARYEYSPYGELLTNLTGSYAGWANPFRFSTKYSDGESGLVYFGYRYYSPETGRWINRDPAEEAGGANLYAFVDNDINGYDYLGLAQVLISIQRTPGGIYGTRGKFTMTAEGFTKIVSGSSLELKGGTYRLWPLGDRDNGVKSYPIPAGEYEVISVETYKNAPAFRLKDKSKTNFTGILLHVGNLVWNSEGCVLIGASNGLMTVKREDGLHRVHLTAPQWKHAIALGLARQTKVDKGMEQGETEWLSSSGDKLREMNRFYKEVVAKYGEKCICFKVVIDSIPSSAPCSQPVRDATGGPTDVGGDL